MFHVPLDSTFSPENKQERKTINIVLVGSTGVGKSCLFNRLNSGKYDCSPTNVETNNCVIHVSVINGVKYDASICTKNDACTKQKSFTRSEYIWRNKKVDVFIVVFAIDDPSSLAQAINFRIPFFRNNYRETPILLVGAKADLREETNSHLNLYPIELDLWLSGSVGAVKYVECSSKTNFNVREVLKEAVRAFLSKPSREIVDIDLASQKNNDGTSGIDSEWNAAVCEHDMHIFSFLFPVSTQFLQEDLNAVDHILSKIPAEIKTHSRNDVSMCRVLEFDRIRLSYKSYDIRFAIGEDFPPKCRLWYLSFNTDHNRSKNVPVVKCQSFSVTECFGNVLCSKLICPTNLRFFATDCRSIVSFLINTSDPLLVRSLVIVNCSGTLNFSFLANLTGLEYLVIVNTDVDMPSFSCPPHLHDTMKHLVLNNCGIIHATDVPVGLGKLVNLQLLNLVNNNFERLPTTLCCLQQLHTLLIDHENMVFPPVSVLRRSVQDVINYLDGFVEDPVENKESKLIVVGQEGVGKSTLIKAMKRRQWLTNNKPAGKTDGVDISILSLTDGIRCKVYDLAGDVEYLNTHSLFLSSNCLHLVIFDLSHVIVDKGARSQDQLCRLELWLETIASQDPKSYVILVGTHADHPLMNTEMIMKTRKLLGEVLTKYRSKHITSSLTAYEECMICNPEKSTETLESYKLLNSDTLPEASSSTSSSSLIPHILGYVEVSGTTQYPNAFPSLNNTNVEKLKSLAASSITNIMRAASIESIPRQWVLFRDTISGKLSSNDELKQQPVMYLSQVNEMAIEIGMDRLAHPRRERVVAMLRFFHSQGTFLWYEDLPEMKHIVIMNPQWLSDQLRTLISHRPCGNSICHGVLHLSELPTIWAHMSEENRCKLLRLFKSVGICISISDTEELFPCNLLVGWPDREMWPPLPNAGENQTSLLFEFSFVPPSLFPDLIVEVNKKSATFAKDVKPLYYRFHIVYIRKDRRLNVSKDDKFFQGASMNDENGLPTQPSTVLHTVHYELKPYNNSLTVAIRGPHPPTIIPDVRSTIETVNQRRYPGVTYSETVLCPECVMKRVQPPSSFGLDVSHDGACSRGHKVGSNEDILNGKFKPENIVPSAIAQAGRIVGETLEDRFCPKLFVVLPINLKCVSLKDRFVYSHLRDGLAVHLLCECPDQWHFVDSPGFRVGKPKEFFEKYGIRVCKVLRYISTLTTPLKVAASLDPNCKAGAAVGIAAKSAYQELESLLDSYLVKYPHLKPSLGSSQDDLKDLKLSSGLQRTELSRFLNIEAKGHNFGPLVCTYVDTHNKWLWLCEEHNTSFKLLEA